MADIKEKQRLPIKILDKTKVEAEQIKDNLVDVRTKNDLSTNENGEDYVVNKIEESMKQLSKKEMLMTEDSEESSELRLLYAEYGSMSEYVFFNMDYLHNTPEYLDVITFNYVKDEILKTGVIIVKKVTETTETDLNNAFK